MTNIQKHARASQISLRSQSTSENIILTLTDNGRGFDLKQPISGLGLQGMKERVQLFGGKLEIDSHPGRGTQIQVTIPP